MCQTWLMPAAMNSRLSRTRRVVRRVGLVIEAVRLKSWPAACRFAEKGGRKAIGQPETRPRASKQVFLGIKQAAAIAFIAEAAIKKIILKTFP